MAESESERKCLYLERCIQTSSDLKKKESHNSESTQIENIYSILKRNCDKRGQAKDTFNELSSFEENTLESSKNYPPFYVAYYQDKHYQSF